MQLRAGSTILDATYIAALRQVSNTQARTHHRLGCLLSGHSIPLAAAFALEERKKLLLKERAEAVNAENRQRSSGSVTGTENVYFSPAEVRAMSQAEVRRNYNLIIESMKSWH